MIVSPTNDGDRVPLMLALLSTGRLPLPYISWGGIRAQTPGCGCALASSELVAVLYAHIMSAL
jgi:hypothetical protein